MYLQMIDMHKQLSASVISNDSHISHRNISQDSYEWETYIFCK